MKFINKKQRNKTMKYEFNFTWKDVLRDAGLDVSEEKITASLFQKSK